MPKKKTIETTSDEEIENEEEAGTEKESKPETIPDVIQLKALEIESHFDSLGDLYGVRLDPANPFHRIVAAWLVGRSGMLRK